MEIRAEINTFTLSKQETNQGSIVVSIGIARLFVRQLSKTNVIECRSSLAVKHGPGGI